MIKSDLILSIISIFIVSCSADIGSEEWCEELKEKPKDNWTANELTHYAKHCIF